MRHFFDRPLYFHSDRHVSHIMCGHKQSCNSEFFSNTDPKKFLVFTLMESLAQWDYLEKKISWIRISF